MHCGCKKCGRRKGGTGRYAARGGTTRMGAGTRMLARTRKGGTRNMGAGTYRHKGGTRIMGGRKGGTRTMGARSIRKKYHKKRFGMF